MNAYDVEKIAQAVVDYIYINSFWLEDTIYNDKAESKKQVILSEIFCIIEHEMLKLMMVAEDKTNDEYD